MTCPGARINATMDYAVTQEGMIGGFPNFEQGLSEGNVVYGTHLITSEAAEFRNVPGNEINNPNRKDVPTIFREANRYALRHGYAAGIPTLHRSRDIYGMILFRPGMADIRSIKVSDLAELIPNDDGSRFREVFRYKNKNDMPYTAAFPNFEEGIEDGIHVYGVVFLKAEAIQTRIIPASVFDLPTYDQRFCYPPPELTNRAIQEIESALRSLALGNEGYVRVEDYDITWTRVKAKVRIKLKQVTNGIILYSDHIYVDLDIDLLNLEEARTNVCRGLPGTISDIIGQREVCVDIRDLVNILVTIFA